MLEKIRDGRTDLVFEYVAGGGAASDTDAGGVPLIRWCAYYGDVSAIRFLLAHGEVLSTLGANLDLNGAAFHGHWRLCQYLLEQGADVNFALPGTGETALHAALSKANRPASELIVQLLLAAGADANAATTAGAETGCFMRDVRTRGETALHRAAAFASEAVVDRLLAAGASREARDSHEETPLSWASWHLRPSGILRKLCFGAHAIHADAHWEGDHGAGWTGMDANLAGKVHPS
jgi:ankyrin repeat protein